MSIYNHTQHANCPAAGAAVVPETIIGEVLVDGTISDISLIFAAAITAADATARTLTAYNRGQDGTGTTVVATLVTNLAQGNIAAADSVPMTLSAVADALDVVAGDVIEIVETVAGAGTAHSGWRSKLSVLAADG